MPVAVAAKALLDVVVDEVGWVLMLVVALAQLPLGAWEESLLFDSFDDDLSREDEEPDDVEVADEFEKLLFAELLALSLLSFSLLEVDLLRLLLCLSL